MARKSAFIGAIVATVIASAPLPGVSADANFHVIMTEVTCKIELPGNAVGTGFVMWQDEASTNSRPKTVLITASHVFEKANAATQAVLHLRTFPKVSTNYLQVPVPVRIRDEKGNSLWVKHPKVDLAAMRLPLPQWLPRPHVSSNVLIGDKEIEEHAITPGFEVFCLGFPFGIEGPEKFPVLRSARIASHPLTPTSPKTSELGQLLLPVAHSPAIRFVFPTYCGVWGLQSSSSTHKWVGSHRFVRFSYARGHTTPTVATIR